MPSHTPPPQPPAPVVCAARTELIRETAYVLWERAGRPNGQALEHWLRAEAEVMRMAHDGAAAQGGTAGAPLP